jgi:glycosyltransferase involved in cell wall biosynthesis
VAPELAPALRAVHTVCANGDALQSVRAFLGDHAVELPIGLDTEIFAPGQSSIRSALGWDASHFVVGYVGRLTHLKGVDLLAAAFREVARDAPEARLLLIGVGEEERHIRTVLANEFARALVHVEPGIDHEELPAWYRAMDLMVMPSRYENHSNALLEAMGCGLPFLVSNVGGNQKLGESGAGWLFEPGSAQDLSRSLRQILPNRAEAKERGEVARRSVRDHYSWAASAESVEELIVSSQQKAMQHNALARSERAALRSIRPV